MSALGYHHSDATKARIAAALAGRRHTPETRAKIAAAKTGSRHSPETLAKMKAAAKARGAPAIFKDPTYMVRHAERSRETMTRRMQEPAFRAAAAERLRLWSLRHRLLAFARNALLAVR